ncbi:MAG TPA: adenylate/guanylate cyclase domain-containing protein [Candidatus Limnocylindrales bacterium]|nr:adenylate/guanylate cyclase domain-containing protein [Candidatus Limnocylindrales bacterium]
MTTAAAPATNQPIPRWRLALLALPVVGLAVVLLQPELDLEWQHHPSHFWIVLVTAAVNVALAYVTNVAAARHRDARVMLVSLAFLASAGFLGLHALATPGVLLPASNIGFAIATPVGLFIASAFAAASVSALGGPRGDLIHRYHRAILALLAAAMIAWGAVSLAGLPPLNGPPPASETTGLLDVLAAAAIALYVFAAWRYVAIQRERGDLLSLAVAVAFVLLAEATLAVVASRNWHLSWWEWHLLMLAAFVAIALGARDEYRRSRSLTGAFGGLYSQATLARIDRWHARAIAAVADAEARNEGTARVLEELRREGASDDEVALLSETATELRRLDSLFRPYLPTGVADELRRDPGLARLGGEEREVSVLFADLAGFTTFSERHQPAEVIGMLNAYWAVVVPVIDAARGVVEYFAGDGVLAIFNAAGTEPNHAGRAVEAGLAIAAAAGPVADAHPGWPTFRVGVNSGPAVVGNVGAVGRRSFTAIGDTTNTAARLLVAAEPGQVVVSDATWGRLEGRARGFSLGALTVKGKRDRVGAWVVTGLAISRG